MDILKWIKLNIKLEIIKILTPIEWQKQQSMNELINRNSNIEITVRLKHCQLYNLKQQYHMTSQAWFKWRGWKLMGKSFNKNPVTAKWVCDNVIQHLLVRVILFLLSDA